jgi:hypothetical protein
MATATHLLAQSVVANTDFLGEIEEVHAGLWRRLAELQYHFSRPISLRDESFAFVPQLAELRDQLALDFALKEAYGYLDEHPSSTMSPQATASRNTHRQLYQHLCDITEDAERLLREGKPVSLAVSIPIAFNGFLSRMQAYEVAEPVHQASRRVSRRATLSMSCSF